VDQAEITFQLGEGVCGTAATTLTACYVANAEEDQTHYRVHPGTPRSKGSLLSVPMLHGQELLGVLNFERPEKHAFTPENIRFLTAVADQAALAVKNAQLHEETVELSLTDALTQVSNRRHLFARLETEVARANRFGTQLAVLMIDIDHFKKLNDAAGHRAGDDALRAVSALLRNSLRKVDIIARYGGEEFMVVLPEISKAEAVEVAEKLRQSVEQTPLEYARFQPSGILSISVGVSHLPSDATVQEKLIDCADASLYASKRGGRNKVTAFAPGMEAHPGRERGPLAAKRSRTTELPAARPQSNS
jgi:diguanylate cyclase (GGDEF)-like protein